MAIAWNPDYRPGGGRSPFVLTITNNPVTTPHTENPGVGTLVATGGAPTIWNNASVYAPDVGALTLAGAAPDRLVDAPFAPGAGALTLASDAPTANETHSAAPGAGSVVVAGEVPAVV